MMAASVAAGWVVLLAVTGSAIGAAVLLVIFGGLGVVALLGLRALGVTRDHPLVQHLTARPWRDGQEPPPASAQPGNGRAQPGPRFSQFAYSGPAVIPPGSQLAYASARPARSEFHPGDDGPPYPDFAAHDGNTQAEPEPFLAAASGMPTAAEQSRRPIPLLRLVTGDSVAETTISGARAGRGAVELGLPQVPTVSREHGRFTFASGQWWITNLGRNGITVNGVPVASQRPLSTGDSIRWGTRPDALLSWVEISSK